MADVPLNVSPVELRGSASKIDEHARVFVSAHEAAHALAGGVSLGSGSAAAALPGMLAAWEQHRMVFEGHFARHAEC